MNITTNDFTVIEKVFPNWKTIVQGINKRPEGVEFISVAQTDAQQHPTINFKVGTLTPGNLIPILEMIKNNPGCSDVCGSNLTVYAAKKGFSVSVLLPCFKEGALHELATGNPMW